MSGSNDVKSPITDIRDTRGEYWRDSPVEMPGTTNEGVLLQ